MVSEVSEDMYMYVCIISTLHAFNNHVSTGTNPCINKSFQMLLMHRFVTLITLCYVPFVMAADILFALIDCLAQEHNNNQNIQTCVDCEMVTNEPWHEISNNVAF